MSGYVSKKFSENKAIKWIELFLFSNCFNDGDNIHLGFKFNESYYCMTHSNSPVKIPVRAVRLKKENDKIMYLAKMISKPKKLHSTGARISKLFVIENIGKIKSEE